MHAAKATILIAVLTLGMLPMIQAAPDTPPSVTWELELAGATCTRTGVVGPRGISLSIDSTDNVYVMSRCDTPTSAGFDALLVHQVTSGGILGWQQTFGCVVGSACDLTPGGVAAEPDANGNVAVCYSDTTSGNTNGVIFSWLQKSDGDVIDQLTGADTALLGGAVTDSCFSGLSDGEPHSLAVSIHNATALNYWIGGQSSLIMLRCTNYSESNCTRIFSRSGDPDGNYLVTEGAATGDYRYFYQCDNSPTMTVRRVNPTTGGSDATATYSAGTNELRWCGRQAGSTPHFWYTFVYDATNGEAQYEKLNATTLAVSAQVTPTEPTISGHTLFNFFGHDVDGEDNLFYCGRATASSNGKAAIMKVSSATTSQRWNITYDDTAVTTTSEKFVDCKIGSDGALYVLYVQVNSAGTAKTTVRKYAGAGVGRTAITGFDGFPDFIDTDVTPTPTFAGAEFGTGLVAFANDIGFESEGGLFFFGLILVIIVFVVCAGAAFGVTKNGMVGTIVGTVGGLGMMVFNTLQLLWPAWTTVVLIMLTVATVITITKKLFIDGAGG